MCFIHGFIRRLILQAIVHKKENHGSIVVGESRKFTSSFLTTIKTQLQIAKFIRKAYTVPIFIDPFNVFSDPFQLSRVMSFGKV